MTTVRPPRVATFDDFIRGSSGWIWVIVVISAPALYVTAISASSGSPIFDQDLLWAGALALISGLCYRTLATKWGTGGVFIVAICLPLAVGMAAIVALWLGWGEDGPGAGAEVIVLPALVFLAVIAAVLIQFAVWSTRVGRGGPAGPDIA